MRNYGYAAGLRYTGLSPRNPTCTLQLGADGPLSPMPPPLPHLVQRAASLISNKESDVSDVVTFQAAVFPECRPDQSNALGASSLNALFSRHSSGLLQSRWSSP